MLTDEEIAQMRTEYERLTRDYDDARTAAKGWEHAAKTLGDMYAETRAMLRELVAAADASYVDIHLFAGPGHSNIIGPFQGAIDKARALLARSDGGAETASEVERLRAENAALREMVDDVRAILAFSVDEAPPERVDRAAHEALTRLAQPPADGDATSAEERDE